MKVIKTNLYRFDVAMSIDFTAWEAWILMPFAIIIFRENLILTKTNGNIENEPQRIYFRLGYVKVTRAPQR